MTSLSFPGNVSFGGTVSSPLFVSNQQIIAPFAAGTLSTLSVGSFASTYSNVRQAYAATLTVGTILNFSAGGTLGTNLMLYGTLTASSINSTFLNVSTLSGNVANLTGSLILGAAYGVSTLSSQTLTVLSTANQTLNNTNSGGTTSYGQAFFVKAGDSVGNYWGGSPSVNGADLNIQAGNVNIGSSNNGTAYVNGTGGFVRLYPGFASVTTTAAASSLNVNSGQIWLYSCNTNGNNQNPVYTPGLILNNFGNVGINTTTPTFQLDVSGSTKVTNLTCSNPSLTTSGSYLTALNPGLTAGANVYSVWGSSTAVAGSSYKNYVAGSTLTASSRWGLVSLPDALTVAAAGTICNVGVNNTAPAYSLDVTGSARVSIASGPNSNPSLICGMGTLSSIMLCPSLAASNYNNLTQSGDAGLIFGTSAGATASFLIAPWTAASSGIRITSTGATCNTGINTTSPAYTLDVNGTISATGNIIAFNSTSDRRLKEDIKNLQNTGVVIDALRPVDFRWKKDVYHEPVRGKRDIGLIAQEVHKDFPLAHGIKLVYGESIETVDYLKLVPVLLAEVKDLRQRVKYLESRVPNSTCNV